MKTIERTFTVPEWALQRWLKERWGKGVDTAFWTENFLESISKPQAPEREHITLGATCWCEPAVYHAIGKGQLALEADLGTLEATPEPAEATLEATPEP